MNQPRVYAPLNNSTVYEQCLRRHYVELLTLWSDISGQLLETHQHQLVLGGKKENMVKFLNLLATNWVEVSK